MTDGDETSPISDSSAETTPIGREGAASGEGAPPPVIGPYKILKTLGEGGMGTVYLAQETGAIERKVALKIVKLGMDTKQVIARFESERQALAMMSHPNVAKVFAAGTTEHGRPYFAMEYVDGAPITEYCDQHRLDIDARLELFSAVCSAVQHAHQKGIIHRDLKPGNVLVTVEDGQPVPRVIDFGIAKATERQLTQKTVFTEHGQLIGTPAYMSPEQAEMTNLDIDTRTDIYSLGVLLYELLTGALPFASETLRRAAFDQLLRIIREQEPPRPSARVSTLGEDSQALARHRDTDPATLARELRGDLDWIVMKALEKDRTRRYESAVELAADIRRHLADEPVSASPPGATYRLGKFIRRNRIAVIAGSAVLAALLVGLIVSSSLYVRSERERRRAVEAEALAENRLAQSTAVTGFLQNMLSAADPFQAEPQPKDLSVREAVDAAASRIDEEFTGQPEVEAAVRYTMGVTYHGLAELEEAEEQLSAALSVQRQLHGNHHPDAMETLWSLALVKEHQEDRASSRRLLQELLTLSRARPQELNTYTANALHELAFIAYVEGRYVEADSLFAEVLPLRHEAEGGASEGLGQTLHAYGMVKKLLGQHEEAERLLREALEVKRQVYGDDHPDVAECITNLGHFLLSQGRLEEAESLAIEGYEMARRLLGDGHTRTINLAWQVGNVLRSQGRTGEAKDFTLTNLARQREVLGDRHVRLKSTLYQLGHIALGLDELAEAEHWYREALAVLELEYGPDHKDVEPALRLVASVARERGAYAEAASLHRRALAIARSTRQGLALSLFQAGRILIDAEEYSEAEAILRESLAVARKERGENSVAVIWSQAHLGRAVGYLGKHAEAESLITGARAVARAAQPETHTIHSSLQSLHGEILGLAGRHEEAESELLSAVTALEAQDGPGGRSTRRPIMKLAALYEAWGKPQEAAGWRARLEGNAD
jgi:serine/threonine protein kinase